VFINFFLENSLPRGQSWNLSIKNESISFVPDALSTYHEDFHEEKIGETSFGNDQLLMNINILLPGETQHKPPFMPVR
jgi:hypothetical protein